MHFEHFFKIYKHYIFFPIYFLIRIFIKTDCIYCKKYYDTYYDLCDEENKEYY